MSQQLIAYLPTHGQLKKVVRIFKEKGMPGVWGALSPYLLNFMRTTKGRWEAGKFNEVRFWDDYFRTKGLQWPANYVNRLNPESLLQARVAALLPEGPEVSILDVGAGPLTYLGKKYPGNKVNIVAVDPLADEYDSILRKYGVIPPVRTVKAAAEEIAGHFAPNTFDLVFARNCMDHAYAPVEAIGQMLRVAKHGGYVMLEHTPNEADNHGHSGLHQWNFSTDDEGEFVVTGRRGRGVNVTERFSQEASTGCEYIVDADGANWLVVTMRKHSAGLHMLGGAVVQHTYIEN